MKRYLVYLLIIIHPYKDLEYNEPNLYIIEEPETLEVVEILGEGYLEPDKEKLQEELINYIDNYSRQQRYESRHNFPY